MASPLELKQRRILRRLVNESNDIREMEEGEEFQEGSVYFGFLNFNDEEPSIFTSSARTTSMRPGSPKPGMKPLAAAIKNILGLEPE